MHRSHRPGVRALVAGLLVALALPLSANAQHTLDGMILYQNVGPLLESSGATCGVPLINMSHNDIATDPLLGGAYFPTSNFKPGPGSPASGDVDDVPVISHPNADPCDNCNSQRSFVQTCYRGAVDPLAANSWTDGWTCNEFLGTCRGPLQNFVFLSGAQATQTWTANNTYVLQGKVWFPAGTTLTIDPGVIVLGENATAGYLTIDRGAQIFANGTAQDPIVMTTDIDPPISGGWGGLVIHGRSVANCADCLGGASCVSEGGAGDFCGTDDCDNSGSIRYTRVQYSGVEISVDNELNSFTFNGVGANTTAEFLQAHQGSDDAFEWFGGKANASHLLATGMGDDGVDWQMGFRGTVQFAIVQMYDNQGDKGIEADNNENNFDAVCRSDPLIANCTFIGPPNPGVATATHGIHLRRGTDAQIFSSIIQGFPLEAIRYQHVETCARGVNPQPPTFCGPPPNSAPTLASSDDFTVRAFPNPVVNHTEFAFSMPQSGHGRIDVYDVSGRLVDNVMDDQLSAGSHRVSWSPDGLAPGAYFYRFQSDSKVAKGKITVVR